MCPFYVSFYILVVSGDSGRVNKMVLNKSKANTGVRRAVQVAGSLRKLAALCDVTNPAVVKWLYVSVPAERALQIEKATGVPRQSMRPDLWNNDNDTK